MPAHCAAFLSPALDVRRLPPRTPLPQMRAGLPGADLLAPQIAAALVRAPVRPQAPLSPLSPSLFCPLGRHRPQLSTPFLRQRTCTSPTRPRPPPGTRPPPPAPAPPPSPPPSAPPRPPAPGSSSAGSGAADSTSRSAARRAACRLAVCFLFVAPVVVSCSLQTRLAAQNLCVFLLPEWGCLEIMNADRPRPTPDARLQVLSALASAAQELSGAGPSAVPPPRPPGAPEAPRGQGPGAEGAGPAERKRRAGFPCPSPPTPAHLVAPHASRLASPLNPDSRPARDSSPQGKDPPVRPSEPGKEEGGGGRRRGWAGGARASRRGKRVRRRRGRVHASSHGAPAMLMLHRAAAAAAAARCGGPRTT